MATEVRSFAVSIPAGTLSTAPQVSALTMPPRIVTSIRVRVPPGPRGLMGWAISASGTVILPWNAGAWMVQDDEVTDWPLEGQIMSGAWQLTAYNTGVYAHSVYLTFSLEPIGSRAGLTLVTPLAITA